MGPRGSHPSAVPAEETDSINNEVNHRSNALHVLLGSLVAQACVTNYSETGYQLATHARDLVDVDGVRRSDRSSGEGARGAVRGNAGPVGAFDLLQFAQLGGLLLRAEIAAGSAWDRRSARRRRLQISTDLRREEPRSGSRSAIGSPSRLLSEELDDKLRKEFNDPVGSIQPYVCGDDDRLRNRTPATSGMPTPRRRGGELHRRRPGLRLRAPVESAGPDEDRSSVLLRKQGSRP